MSWQVICDGTDVSNTMIKFQDIYDYVTGKDTINVQVLLNGVTINDFEWSYRIANHSSVKNFSITGISGSPSPCNVSTSLIMGLGSYMFQAECKITFTNIKISIISAESAITLPILININASNVNVNLMNCILDGGAYGACLMISLGTLSITNTTLQNCGSLAYPGINILGGIVNKLDFNNISNNGGTSTIVINNNLTCDIFVHGDITNNAGSVFSISGAVEGNIEIYGKCADNKSSVIMCSSGSLLGNILIHGDCIDNGRVIYGAIKGNITILGNCNNSLGFNSIGLIYLDRVQATGNVVPSITINNCSGTHVSSAISVRLMGYKSELNIFGNFNNNNVNNGNGGVIYIASDDDTSIVNMYGSYNNNTAKYGGVVYISGGGILNMYGDCSGNKTINEGNGCIVYTEPNNKSGEVNLKSSCVGYGDADPKDIVHINGTHPVKLIGNYPIGARIKY